MVILITTFDKKFSELLKLLNYQFGWSLLNTDFSIYFQNEDDKLVIQDILHIYENDILLIKNVSENCFEIELAQKYTPLS